MPLNMAQIALYMSIHEFDVNVYKKCSIIFFSVTACSVYKAVVNLQFHIKYEKSSWAVYVHFYQKFDNCNKGFMFICRQRI